MRATKIVLLLTRILGSTVSDEHKMRVQHKNKSMNLNGACVQCEIHVFVVLLPLSQSAVVNAERRRINFPTARNVMMCVCVCAQ